MSEEKCTGKTHTDGDEMSKPHGIIVFGANASGKSTLGRELARILGFKYMRHEDYYFEKSEIPYTVERSYEDWYICILPTPRKESQNRVSRNNT